MKSSGERKFYKINAKFKPAFCQYNVVCSAIFHFSAVFSDIFKQICQNFSIFIFKKKIGCFLNNFVRFFSMINNVFFQFEDFQLQIFQTFIFSILFWEKYFSAEFFFRIIFVKFQRQIFQIFEELIFKISSRIFWAIAHNGLELCEVAD